MFLCVDKTSCELKSGCCFNILGLSCPSKGS